VSEAGPDRFLPGRHVIDAYGNGGFRFADMSHRGSILCLPSGVRAWSGVLDLDSLAPVVAEAGTDLAVLLVGTGRTIAPIATDIRMALRAAGISVDPMDTGSAARTWNILVGERRPVAAALIAVD
jgi:uncharacterized protein